MSAEAAALIPAASTFPLDHESATSVARPQQNKTLAQPAGRAAARQTNKSEHQNDTFLHAQCVMCVSELPNARGAVKLPPEVTMGMPIGP
jgi:hypothetical protein